MNGGIDSLFVDFHVYSLEMSGLSVLDRKKSWEDQRPDDRHALVSSKRRRQVL